MTRNENTEEPGAESMCSSVCKPFDTDLWDQTDQGRSEDSECIGSGCSRHHKNEKTMSVRANDDE